MKKTDIVLKQLSNLYEFHKKLKSYRFASVQEHDTYSDKDMIGWKREDHLTPTEKVEIKEKLTRKP